MIKWLEDLRLFWKIFLVGLAVSVIPILLLSVVSLRQNDRIFTERLNEKVSRYYQNLSQTVKLALEAQNYRALDQLIARIKDDPEIVYLEIRRQDGSPYRRVPSDRSLEDFGFAGSIETGQMIRSEQGAGFLAFRQVLKIPELGMRPTFGLVASKQHMQKRRRTFLWEVVLIMLTMIGLTALVAYLLAYHLSSRLGNLLSATEDIRNGQFEEPSLEDPSRDEIGRLVDAFNDMENQLKEAWTKMEEKIEERTQQLLFQEKLSVLGEMASRMAHEINTPLATIANASEGLEKRFEESNEQALRLVEMIQEESYRCKEITRQFLDLARADSGEVEEVAIQDLVQETMDTLHYLPLLEDLSPVVETSVPEVTIRVRPGELKQVLVNVIKNALQALEEADSAEPRLNISGERHGNELVLRVIDNGIGFDPENAPDFFEPFVSSKVSKESLGLGLSVSRRIIEEHGGDLSLDSPGRNKGCTVTITIPLNTANESEA